MRHIEPTAHTFVLRLWIEEPAREGDVSWRGHITHLLDEERLYVESVDQIAAFIARYLDRDQSRRDSMDRRGPAS